MANEKISSTDKVHFRQVLREALNPDTIRANAEWCVACGASKSSGPEIPSIVTQEISKNPEILQELLKPSYIKELAEKLSTIDANADWCVACGASSGLDPSERVITPIDKTSLTDEMIDKLANVILTRVK